MSRKKKILITGAHGQVGLQCIQSIKESTEFESLSYSHQEFNINDPSSTDRIFREEFSAVVNCAAYTAVDLAQTETEKAWSTNAVAPKVLARACASKGVPLLHFSTDYVYHNGLQRPLKETDPCNPKSIYAISKYTGEQEALYYHPHTTIIRTSWVYSRNGQNFVNTLRSRSCTRNFANIIPFIQANQGFKLLWHL
jgi:dTDP-4-dehydrorhamnose reductase